MCVATGDRKAAVSGLRSEPSDEQKKPTAADVPLGDGLADAARLSILNRRDRLRAALDET